ERRYSSRRNPSTRMGMHSLPPMYPTMRRMFYLTPFFFGFFAGSGAGGDSDAISGFCHWRRGESTGMYDFSGPGHPAAPRIPTIPSSRSSFMRARYHDMSLT